MGREGRKQGQGEGPEGWVARSPTLLPFCTPCGRQREAASAAARGLCTRRGRLRDPQTDGLTGGEDPPRVPAPWPRGSSLGRRQRTKRSLPFLKTWARAVPSPGRNSVACSARWKGPRRIRPSISTRCRWAGARGRWWLSSGTSPTWAPTRSRRTPVRAGVPAGSHLLNPAGRWRSGGPQARKLCRTSTTRLVWGVVGGDGDGRGDRPSFAPFHLGGEPSTPACPPS